MGVFLMAQVIRPYHPETAAEVVLLGIPFDTTTIMRRGARFGPAAIRAALAATMMLILLAGRQGRAHASRWLGA
jgi:arginase family enzyme